MTTVRDLGVALRARRAQLGWTQEHVAKQAGVTRPWLSRVESGRHPGAQLQKVLDVADVLDLRVVVDPIPRRAAAGADNPFAKLFGD